MVRGFGGEGKSVAQRRGSTKSEREREREREIGR